MTESTEDPAKDNTETQHADDDWAAAMAEQQSHSSQPTQASGLETGADDWASALAEQTAATPTAEPTVPAPDTAPVGQQVFQPLDSSVVSGNSDIDMIMDIPVQLSVELGRTRLTIKNILQLGQGSVVELEGLAGEPMDIFVNGYLIAQGEVVVVDEKYGIRVTDIITPADRLNRLNSKR